MEFPKNTELNKRIPKQKFYEKLPMTPALKEEFKSIKSIYWKNKLSPDTINLEAGEMVTEIQVFELNLTQPKISQHILKQIDKQIPYHILFLFKYDNQYQGCIAYKEINNRQNTSTVYQYYYTDWFSKDQLPITLEGINLDKVYENLVRQVAGNELKTIEKENYANLKESIDYNKQIQILKRQIISLENRINKEKQFNRQIEMNAELKKIKRELINLENKIRR